VARNLVAGKAGGESLVWGKYRYFS
jgi:hypothetical protein